MPGISYYPNGHRSNQPWERLAIIEYRHPLLGSIFCHQMIEPVIKDALNVIHEAGLIDELVVIQGYAPRRKNHKPSAPLSAHAWGIAFDLNPQRNLPGNPTPQFISHHPIVLIMKSFGFNWGGDWKTPDPMHFQWCTGY